MCGIAGRINFDSSNLIDETELRRMTNSIIHRGPDDEGFYINANIGLGFRRLSIIDLNTGHQPLTDSNNDVWITFNGEIYNYQSLRADLIKRGYSFRTETDTEVILNLYLHYGEKCLSHLRGMFAFVIWDNRLKQLFGARDHFGIKPFYYYLDNNSFIWSSELKAINQAEGVVKSLSLEALDSYFTYGYILQDQSIFSQIKKLKPAHYFILRPFDANKLTIDKYWDIEFDPDYSKSEEYWAQSIQEALHESVKLQMISDVPLGAFLSGGIDSSSVVALMAKSTNRPVKTFSIGFKEKEFNELELARLVAKKYNTEHHELIVEPESITLLEKLVRAFDEPFADNSAIPTYYVSKFAREKVTVALSGDGGDEMYAGYNSY
jgi:asparagine synthase (glutamine-hydrolysing)